MSSHYKISPTQTMFKSTPKSFSSPDFEKFYKAKLWFVGIGVKIELKPVVFRRKAAGFI